MDPSAVEAWLRALGQMQLRWHGAAPALTPMLLHDRGFHVAADMSALFGSVGDVAIEMENGVTWTIAFGDLVGDARHVMVIGSADPPHRAWDLTIDTTSFDGLFGAAAGLVKRRGPTATGGGRG